MGERLSFFLDDRDYAHYLISDLDLEAQLIAIRAIIARNSTAAAEASRQIDELAEWARSAKGVESHRTTDFWVDQMHASVFSDAAASMAALGMIAPLTESIFSQAFRSLERMYSARDLAPPDHPRWSRVHDGAIDRWYCNIYIDEDGARTDVAAGIKQLANATGLAAFIIRSDFKLINALLAYRNRMFHMGFEWPMQSRIEFERLIETNGWSSYFTSSRHNEDPWIFYLSDETIASLPDWLDALILKIGRFAKSLPRDLLSA